MFNLRHFIQPILPVAAVVLLCITAAPDAQANNGAATASVQKTETTTTAPQDNKEAKATQKARQKSVLDAEVLERPLSYFKNAFSADEDDNDDLLSHSNTVIITIKALIASLLSTII